MSSFAPRKPRIFSRAKGDKWTVISGTVLRPLQQAAHMPDLNPEQVARQLIDAQLVAFGWPVQASVSGTILRAISVLLPPFAKQTRSVAEAERHLSVVEVFIAGASASANLRRAICVRQSILQKAFSGELKS